jgi:hypothetical protein
MIRVLISALLLISGFCFSLHAAAHDPFPVGYSMGNNGTIIQSNGVSGRQPWIPAAYYNDTLRWGGALCGIDYFDPMDNLQTSHIVQIVSGAWYALHRMNIKISYSFFNAMDLYNEQQGFFSLGYGLSKLIRASIDLTANRSGLSYNSTEHKNFLDAGASVFLTRAYAAISLSCSHFPLKAASASGFEPPPSLCIGLHTTANACGAQGILWEVEKETDFSFRYSIGESLYLTDHCTAGLAISTNPFMIYFGFSFSNAVRGLSFSLVNSPILGWSKGLSMDYAHR